MPVPLSTRIQGSYNRYGKSTWVTLAQHSCDAKDFADAIAKQLSHLNEPWQLLIDCSQWHDYGKAHKQFQAATDQTKELMAKAPKMSHYQRPGFRHELASAIGALIQGKDFEFAYLVAAHHGKCRIQIKNFHFAPDTIGLRAICDGDRLPACHLGYGVKLPEIKLELIDPEDWKNAALALMEDHGVFRLAYLETVVRIADWRASRWRAIPVSQSISESVSGR